MSEKLKSAHENLADEMEKEHKEFVQSCKDSICDEYSYKNRLYVNSWGNPKIRKAKTGNGN